MFALRNLLLLNLLAVCSFAAAVNPLAGYMQWTSNQSTGQGYFQVVVTTNTDDGSAQLPDYISLVNVNLVIDIQVGQSLLTQSVTLHRAISQDQVVSSPATNILFPNGTCAPADCVSPAGTYFTQTIGPDADNDFTAPTIVAARLTYTAVAHTTPLNSPHWRYMDPDTQTTTLFTPQIMARTITLLPGPLYSSFVYDGNDNPLAVLHVSGETVPEPSTLLLCGAGLAAAVAYRRRRGPADLS